MLGGIVPLTDEVVELLHLALVMIMELAAATAHEEAAIRWMSSFAALLAGQALPAFKIRVSG
jgi:hypothetical protein